MVIIREIGSSGPADSASRKGGGGAAYGFQGGEGIEFVGGDATTMQIGTVMVPGIYDYTESGGQNAPTKRTESGFEFTSYVNAEPLEASFSAYVTPETLEALRALRGRGEPFPVYVRSTRIGQCTLDGLTVYESGDTPGVLDVAIDIREIQQATLGETEIQITTATGTKAGGSGGVTDIEDLSYAISKDDDPEETSTADEVEENRKERKEWASGPDFGDDDD